jgi:hypothetical protein
VSSRRHLLLLFGGLLVAASAIPHALLGWPPFAELLGAANVDANAIGGIAASWYFGSAAMLALGAIVVLGWRDARASGDFGWRAALVVGAVYGAFGAVALALRGKAHFLSFLAIGAILVFAALRARPRAR